MKVFETFSDTWKETLVIDHFCKKKGYKFTKLPQFELDFMIHDDKNIVAFVEIKCFNTPSTQYNHQIVSMIKRAKMMKYNALAPTYFMAKYSDDVILYAHCSDLKGEEKMGGRKPREGAANDQEMLVYVPKENFKKL